MMRTRPTADSRRLYIKHLLIRQDYGASVLLSRMKRSLRELERYSLDLDPSVYENDDVDREDGTDTDATDDDRDDCVCGLLTGGRR